MKAAQFIQQVRAVLPGEQHHQLIGLALAMTVGAALETLGLGLLIPVASVVMADWDSIHRVVPSLIPATPPFGSPVAGMILIIGACALAFLLKNIFLAGHAWFEARFASSVHSSLAEKVLGAILTSEADRRWDCPAGSGTTLVTADVTSVVIHTLLPLLTIASEFLLVATIAIFLLIVEPATTLVVFPFVGLVAFVFARQTRRYAHSLGSERQLCETAGMTHLHQTFLGQREITLYGAVQHTLTISRTLFSDLARIQRHQYLLSTLPRFPLELIAVLTLLAIIGAGVFHGDSSQDVLIRLSLFTATGFRSLIGANRLLMSLQHLRFGQASLERVTQELQSRQDENLMVPPSSGPIKHEVVRTLELRQLSYRYHGEDAAADTLTGVNLRIDAGQMIGLSGESGSGKSTLLDLIAGLREPTDGQIYANGEEVATKTEKWRRNIGYVSQTPLLFRESVRANIAFGIAPAEVDQEALAHAIRGAQLERVIASLPLGIDTRIGEGENMLSGGQRQRIAIARALYRKPDILLLDEPTSALDGETEQAFVETLTSLKPGRIILVASHRPVPLAYCDRVVRLTKDIQGRPHSAASIGMHSADTDDD